MSARPGTLFVICAPSGAGKSTLVARLRAAFPELGFSVSWTTRPPRPGEVDGREYRFAGEPQFRALIAEGALLEWAEVHGRLYGTARADVETALAAGRDLLLDIDVQGAEQVRRSGLPAVSTFVLPPDRATLEARLRGRGTEDEAALARRLANAAREVARWPEFDYLVVNDDLDRAAAELAAIVTAARQARRAMDPRARAIARTFDAEPAR
ncbi:MAG: guanylate kinase [Acidobacteria bacterium]|jgi:guanylate kinase|nr:guanylate kinase [Acidobacteriota bacterium]